MIRRHRSAALLALIACTALGLAAPWSARAGPLSQDHGEELAGEHEESPLGQAMERMKGAARRLERVLQGDDAATALGLVADFQAGVVAAKSEVPPRAGPLAGAEQEAFVTDYRATMVKLLRVTCDLEQALLENRLEDARRIFTDELKAMQKPSHDRFQEDGD